MFLCEWKWAFTELSVATGNAHLSQFCPLCCRLRVYESHVYPDDIPTWRRWLQSNSVVSLLDEAWVHPKHLGQYSLSAALVSTRQWHCHTCHTRSTYGIEILAGHKQSMCVSMLCGSGIESTALHTVGQCSATKPQPSQQHALVASLSTVWKAQSPSWKKASILHSIGKAQKTQLWSTGSLLGRPRGLGLRAWQRRRQCYGLASYFLTIQTKEWQLV